MYRTSHGLDAGRHEQEHDPVSDSINDMIEDFTHAPYVQSYLRSVIESIDGLISDVESAVHNMPGCESWQYPSDGDLKALRGAIETYLDEPKGKADAR